MKVIWHLGILIAFALAGSSTARGFAAEEVAPNGFDQTRDVPHGQVKPETYDSRTLGFERKMTVYLPPGFSKDQKYPVLYLFAKRLFSN